MKAFLLKALDYLCGLLARSLSSFPFEYVEYFRNKFYFDFLISSDAKIGWNLKIDGKVCVTNKKNLLLGRNVSLFGECEIETEGGVCIGDSSVVNRGCKIYSSVYAGNDEVIHGAVYIGKNVQIMNGAIIHQNTIIADGSIVPSSAVITEHDNPYSPDIERYKDFQFVSNREIFFILSTGRAGSASMASFLSQHKDIECLHEPKSQLIRLSTECEQNEVSSLQVLRELEYLYGKCTLSTGEFYGESDQKLSNLVGPLSIMFPNSKFVWLVRRPESVVRSMVKRQWYVPIASKDFRHKYRKNDREQWETYRLRGDKCGDVAIDTWQRMSATEK